MFLSGEKYRHYKGGDYTVICEAIDEATGESIIVYRSDKNGQIFTRPTKVFDGDARNGFKRFVKIDNHSGNESIKPLLLDDVVAKIRDRMGRYGQDADDALRQVSIDLIVLANDS